MRVVADIDELMFKAIVHDSVAAACNSVPSLIVADDSMIRSHLEREKDNALVALVNSAWIVALVWTQFCPRDRSGLGSVP